MASLHPSSSNDDSSSSRSRRRSTRSRSRSKDKHRDSKKGNPSGAPHGSEMNRHMQSLLKQPANQVCADCPATRPLWASFLSGDNHGGPTHMGVLVCPSCAQHHHYQLGPNRCHIQYLKMAHEWSLRQVLVLERSGNRVVNRVLEQNLTRDRFDKGLVLEDEAEEDERRGKFVKHKYRKHKFADPLVYHELVLDLLEQGREGEKDKQQQQQPPEEEAEQREPKRSSVRSSARERRPAVSASPSPSRGPAFQRSNSTEPALAAALAPPSTAEPSGFKAPPAPLKRSSTKESKSLSPTRNANEDHKPRSKRNGGKKKLHGSCPNLQGMMEDLQEFEREMPAAPRRSSNSKIPPRSSASKSPVPAPARGLARQASRRSRRKLLLGDDADKTGRQPQRQRSFRHRATKRASRKSSFEHSHHPASSEELTTEQELELLLEQQQQQLREQQRQLLKQEQPQPARKKSAWDYLKRQSSQSSLHGSCPNLQLEDDAEDTAPKEKTTQHNDRRRHLARHRSAASLLEEKEEEKPRRLPLRRAGSNPDFMGPARKHHHHHKSKSPKRSSHRLMTTGTKKHSSSSPNLLGAAKPRLSSSRLGSRTSLRQSTATTTSSSKKNATWGKKPTNQLQGLADDFIRNTIVNVMHHRQEQELRGSTNRNKPSRVINISRDETTESTVDADHSMEDYWMARPKLANTITAAAAARVSGSGDRKTMKKPSSGSGLSGLKSTFKKRSSSRKLLVEQ